MLMLWWMGKRKRKAAMLACEGSEKKPLAPWNIILFHQVKVRYGELIVFL